MLAQVDVVWLSGWAQFADIVGQLVLVFVEDGSDLLTVEQALVIGAGHSLLALLLRVKAALDHCAFVGQGPSELIPFLKRFAHSLRPLHRARLLRDVIFDRVFSCLKSGCLVLVIEECLESVITILLIVF